MRKKRKRPSKALWFLLRWYSKAHICEQKYNQKTKDDLKTLNNYRKEHQLSCFSELN